MSGSAAAAGWAGQGPARLAAARALRATSAGCLVAMAPVMVVAHRSTLATLVLAAFLALSGGILSGDGREMMARAARLARRPVSVAAGLLAAWAVLSLAWSPHPVLSARAGGEFGLAVAAGFTLALARPAAGCRWLPAAFGLSLVLAAGMLAADLATGLAARRLAGLRPDSFVLNRPALTLLVLLPAALLLLTRERRLVLAAATALAVAGAILSSDSGAARLGLAAAGGAALLAWLRPSFAVVSAALGLALALALAPIQGELADRALPASLHGTLAGSHSRDRVDIWLAFGAALRTGPLAGQGFGASARLGDAPVAGLVAPEHATYLAVGHPHSAPLQIWVELGAVGIALAAAVLALLLRDMARLGRSGQIFGLSLLAAGASVSLVGQGAWQGWWPAAIAAAIALARTVSEGRVGTAP